MTQKFWTPQVKIPNLEEGKQSGKEKWGLETVIIRTVKDTWEYLALKYLVHDNCPQFKLKARPQ